MSKCQHYNLHYDLDVHTGQAGAGGIICMAPPGCWCHVLVCCRCCLPCSGKITFHSYSSVSVVSVLLSIQRLIPLDYEWYCKNGMHDLYIWQKAGMRKMTQNNKKRWLFHFNLENVAICSISCIDVFNCTCHNLLNIYIYLFIYIIFWLHDPYI